MLLCRSYLAIPLNINVQEEPFLPPFHKLPNIFITVHPAIIIKDISLILSWLQT